MEVRQITSRQFHLTLNEEEAENVRLFLDDLQESDYTESFRRNKVDKPEDQQAIRNDVAKLKEALQLVPVGHSADDTRHL